MNLERNPEVQKFLQLVLQQVRFQQAHEEIRLEYLNHFEESVKLGLSYGLGSEEAIIEAVRRMGNPVEIGTRLDNVHAPKVDLTIILSILILCMIGIYSLSELGFAGRQTIWAGIGFLMAGALAFTKPVHLKKASAYLYPLTLLLLLLSHMSGVADSGQTYIPIAGLNVKIVDLSAVLFLVSMAGLVFRIPKSSKWRTPLVLMLSILPSVYFAVIGAIFPGTLYFVSMVTLLASAKLPWRLVACFTVAGLLLESICARPSLYLAAEDLKSAQATAAHTDFVFHHLLLSTPVLALISLLAFGLLIARSLALASEIHNRFSSALFNSALVMLSLATFWGISGGLGNLPMPQSGVNLPFVSYGGSLMIANLALIGILLGAVRRKSLHFN